MAEFILINDKIRKGYLKVITPIGNLLARFGIHPHIISVIGLIFSVVAAFVFSTGSFFLGALVVTISGICDTLDGQLARETGKGSKFGAFFDSTLDRYSDLFILIGLAWYFAGGSSFIQGARAGFVPIHSPWAVFFVILAIAGSFMVSYSKARAEGLGLNCKVGLMQRPERITVLAVGTALGSIPVIGPKIVILTLFILAISTHLTAVQRILNIRSQLLREN